MSELTLKIIILLIPGGIGAIILERLTVHKPWTSFRFILNAIIIGIFSYLLLQIIVSLIYCIGSFCNCNMVNYPKQLSVWDNIAKSSEISYREVIGSSLFGIIFGLIIAAADTNKWLNTFAKKFKISNKYGDENLYSYFLNARETNYVYLRYIKHNLTYVGYIESFSETDDIKELVLSEVSVYDYAESQLLYEIDKIYLSLPKDDIIIEFAKYKKNGQE